MKLYRPGSRSMVPEMSPEKKAFIAKLIDAYGAKNAQSKASTDTIVAALPIRAQRPDSVLNGRRWCSRSCVTVRKAPHLGHRWQ